TFGKIENGTEAAEHGVAASSAQMEVARSEVAMQTAQAYWGLKAARTSLVTLTEVRDKLQDWQDKIDKDLDSAKPRFTIYDLKRVQLAVVQQELLVEEIK